MADGCADDQYFYIYEKCRTGNSGGMNKIIKTLYYITYIAQMKICYTVCTKSCLFTCSKPMTFLPPEIFQ